MVEFSAGSKSGVGKFSFKIEKTNYNPIREKIKTYTIEQIEEAFNIKPAEPQEEEKKW